MNDSNTLSVGEKMFNYIKTSSKMSWQVRRLQCLSSEFMKRHSKCPYTPLYNYYTDPKTTESSGGQLSLYQVFGFLLAILKRVLPKDFVNCGPFLKHLRQSINSKTRR